MELSNIPNTPKRNTPTKPAHPGEALLRGLARIVGSGTESAVIFDNATETAWWTDSYSLRTFSREEGATLREWITGTLPTLPGEEEGGYAVAVTLRSTRTPEIIPNGRYSRLNPRSIRAIIPGTLEGYAPVPGDGFTPHTQTGDKRQLVLVDTPNGPGCFAVPQLRAAGYTGPECGLWVHSPGKPAIIYTPTGQQGLAMPTRYRDN